MRPAKIEARGKAFFSAHVHGRKTLPGKVTYLCGFDSEFYYPDPDGGPHALSFQLADERYKHFYRLDGKLPISLLSETVYDMMRAVQPNAESIVLLSWFSQAELSIIDLEGINPSREVNPELGFHIIHQGNGLVGWRWWYKPPRKKRVEIMILDLSAYFANPDPFNPKGLSLARAAQEMGLEKMDFDVSNLTPDSVNDADFILYAVNDARLCYEIGAMLRRNHNETWSMQPFGTRSVGHLTAALFQARYVGQKPIFQPHPDVREMALLAYRGSGFAGGLWARGIFEGEWCEFDATSNYPTAAREIGVFPFREAWREWEGGAYRPTGIYKAEFKWPAGVRHRMLMGSVQRATGEGYEYPQFGVDTFSGFELQAAERLGCQVRVISGWWYDPHDFGSETRPLLFRGLGEYLSHLVQLRDLYRQEGNALLVRHYKALSNVLIGKLGQHIKHPRLALELTENGYEYTRQDNTSPILSTVYMPEWWVLITGYAKAVFGEVCAEFDAVHGNVDAVLIRDPGVESFTRQGIEFKKKNCGNLLKLVDRNVWALFRDGEVVRMATYGGKQTPEVAAAFHQWEGQELTVEIPTQGIVKVQQSSRDGRPPLSRKSGVRKMTLISASTPLPYFQQGLEIRPVKRPERRKPGDPPKRGEKAAAMRARLEESRRKSREEMKKGGKMQAVLHGPLHSKKFTVFKSKALIRRELLDAARTIGLKLSISVQDQIVNALKTEMGYENSAENIRVEIL